MEHPTKHDRREDSPADEALRIERHLTDVMSREPNRMALCQFMRDFGAGIARAYDEYAAFAQLRGITIVNRVQLNDPRIEF